MEASDLVMVFFTVVSQMAVGAFLVLGFVQLFLGRGRTPETVERVVRPILYVIGPVLVVGLIVSMFHMHDVTHMFNVILNWQSSWLSREIVFGCLFAGFGFLFAVLEWFGKGGYVLRQVLAAVAALFGVGLVVSQWMIYYSLTAVPAWNSWAVPFQFCVTTVLLGCASVATGLMITHLVRMRGAGNASEAKAGIGARIAEINAPSTEEEWKLTGSVLKVTALVGALAGVAVLVAYPVYVGQLSQGNSASVAAAGVFSGSLLGWRLILTGVGVVVLGFFVYTTAGQATLARAKTLVLFVIIAFVFALGGEFLGRMLHYAAMIKAGM